MFPLTNTMKDYSIYSPKGVNFCPCSKRCPILLDGHYGFRMEYIMDLVHSKKITFSCQKGLLSPEVVRS